MLFFYCFLLFININNAFIIPSIFKEWYCIDFINNIDKSKPYKYNIGDLPLVTWFKNNTPLSTINICSHYGSKLDTGIITSNGCLKCPYHGLEHDELSIFGRTIIFQDKLWWTYNNIKSPPSIPFYNNKNYQTSFIKIDMNANIKDCIFNTMDVNHPKYVHNNLLGFGSDISVNNLKIINYPNKKKLGITFNYKTNSNLLYLKKELKTSNNFHIYEYPFNSWSRVSLPNNENLFINVNLLPLTKNKTRWLITLKYNYWTNDIEKNIIEIAAKYILDQDKKQMNIQGEESILKNAVIYHHKFDNEEHMGKLKELVDFNIYPDIIQVLELYEYHKLKKYNL